MYLIYFPNHGGRKESDQDLDQAKTAEEAIRKAWDWGAKNELQPWEDSETALGDLEKFGRLTWGFEEKEPFYFGSESSYVFIKYVEDKTNA